jgi:electron transfer flavoprotein alpha subunit
MKNGNVAVFIEHFEGKVAEVSLELLSKAEELAKELDCKVSAYIAGHAVDGMIEKLFAYGANKVYAIEHAELKDYRTLPYSKAILLAAKADNPDIFLFGATRIGRDLAPRVASSLKSGLTADCTELKIGEYVDTKTNKKYERLLYQIRPAFGGNIIATIINPERHPQMAIVREGVMKMKQPCVTAKGEIIRLQATFADIDLGVKVLKRIAKEKKVNLKGANIIVSGGMGVGSKENFKLIEELAKTVGGEIGASRAAVDQGWISKDHQVGQTGTTVRPKLYIACGISGSVQHRAGMAESLKIIAINTDKDAPIMGVAHVKIVGDLHEVIPMIIDSYKKLGKEDTANAGACVPGTEIKTETKYETKSDTRSEIRA